MRQRQNYGAIDNFRLVAALLIVAIHTAPLASFHETADFFVTYCVGRVGVQFFRIVSGFFVLAPYQRQRQYASIRKGDSLGGWLKEIFFDGTFYHLWYLPAVVLGCLLIIGLLHFCSPLAVSVTVFVLYILGMLGDSYYNLISQLPFLKMVYEGIFTVSSYTRNGIFFAPLFLWMGVLLANGRVRISRKAAGIGLVISLAGMLAEGFLSYQLEWQKHNSMYFLLIPVMFFLFEWLLSLDCRGVEIARDLSMYIYILHPLCIVLVRGVADALKMKESLVEQSLIHYLAVVLLSVLLSLAVVGAKMIYQKLTMERD